MALHVLLIRRNNTETDTDTEWLAGLRTSVTNVRNKPKLKVCWASMPTLTLMHSLKTYDLRQLQRSSSSYCNNRSNHQGLNLAFLDRSSNHRVTIIFFSCNLQNLHLNGNVVRTVISLLENISTIHNTQKNTQIDSTRSPVRMPNAGYMVGLTAWLWTLATLAFDNAEPGPGPVTRTSLQARPADCRLPDIFWDGLG